MLNLSDNELDDLSREAAEKFEPAENAQSWNKLQQLLDTDLGVPTPIPKTIRPGTIFMYSGAILIAASLTYFLTKTKKNNQNSTPQISTIINKKAQDRRDKTQETRDKVQDGKIKEQELSDKGRRTSDKEKDAEVKTQDARDKEQDTRNKEQAGTNKTQEANDVGKNINNRSGNNNSKEGNTNRAKEIFTEKDLANSSLKEKNNKNNIDEIRSSNGNLSFGNNLVKNNTKQKDISSSGNKHHHRNTIDDEKDKNVDEINSKENTTVSNSSTADVQNDELKFAAIPGLQPVTELYFLINDSSLRSFRSANKLAIVDPRKHRTRGAFINRSLQIGILFAPEFSEVKHIYQNNRIGNNLGITLSYQLFSKISINSGIIFSKKYYQSDDKNFHAPKDAVGNGVDIKFVDASANVIDIPLNLRYNYFSDENSTFFINAGFSSYLMSKQDLNLFCQPNNYNALRYSGAWVQPNANIEAMNKNYLFSILNLSAGFETSMGNNFSFQFEPYVKLPVKGIGYGKVDLSSYGINFSLKYAPVLKRGRRL